MKIKVSDYIINFFSKKGIDTLFTITGGFAMHLNDSFGKSNLYDIYYQHHEQACGYSAVGYSKTNSKPCIVCTTAGCAATNAITPCLVAYQDSLPIIFISGQVKSDEAIGVLNNKKMKLRHYAGADSDIISMVKEITKYSKEIYNINEIQSILEEVMYNLLNGRPGPIWLSIPVDIQGMVIDFDEYKIINNVDIKIHHNTNDFEKINKLIKESQRPVIIAGNGIKLGNCKEKFKYFINKYKIPVVVTILSTDVIETDHELYSGKIGLIGDRHGNFTIQNSDLIISFGCRFAQGVIGYRSEWFARDAKIIYIDNDKNELEKVNLNYELKMNIDLNLFFDNFIYDYIDKKEWINKTNYWKNKWINETPPVEDNIVNPYHVLKYFYKVSPKNKITLASSGSIVTIVWHMVKIKEDDSFIISSQGDMGFEIPAAIGSSIAEKDKLIVPILGEGSLQLNIQELQTIKQYNLPIKILLFNNSSYGAIQITQSNFFKNKFGVDNESGLSFPDTEKICYAYDIKYICIKTNDSIEEKINDFLNYDGIILCEIFCCIQSRYPRLSAIKNDDGTFTNRPFEDMDPFLSREEFTSEMIVKIV